ncbi:hypothetical protein CROQUDRAFT_660808, partial [Cronartium quercuum f. sp. fusiforme G11]
MGIGPTGQIYLNCARKDPCKGFKGGCGFFAWLEVYLSQCAIKNVPIIVTLLFPCGIKLSQSQANPPVQFLVSFNLGACACFG